MLNSPRLEIPLLTEEELAELNLTYASCIDESTPTSPEKIVSFYEKDAEMFSEDAFINHLLSLSIANDELSKSHEEDQLDKQIQSDSTEDKMDDSPTNYSDELDYNAYKSIVVDLARQGGEIEAQGRPGYADHQFEKELAEEAAKYGELERLYTQEFMVAFNFKRAEISQAYDEACRNSPRNMSLR